MVSQSDFCLFIIYSFHYLQILQRPGERPKMGVSGRGGKNGKGKQKKTNIYIQYIIY